MEFKILPGSLTDSYTQTQYSQGSIPRVGDAIFDPSTARKFVFLKNNAASAIPPKLACVALGTDKTSKFCALAAATDGVIGYAGARVDGAANVAQNEYGWFECAGPTLFTVGGTGVTADTPVMTSADAAGKIETYAGTAASLAASFGDAVATVSNGDVTVMVKSNVWGL